MFVLLDYFGDGVVGDVLAVLALLVKVLGSVWMGSNRVCISDWYPKTSVILLLAYYVN